MVQQQQLLSANFPKLLQVRLGPQTNFRELLEPIFLQPDALAVTQPAAYVSK